MLFILCSRTNARPHRSVIYLRLESAHNFGIRHLCRRKYTHICYLLSPYSSKPTVSRGSSQCNGICDANKNPHPPRPANRDPPLKFLTHGPPTPHTHRLYAVAMPELPGAETRMDAPQPIRAQPALDINEYGMGRPNGLDNLRPALHSCLGHVAGDITVPIRCGSAEVREG